VSCGQREVSLAPRDSTGSRVYVTVPDDPVGKEGEAVTDSPARLADSSGIGYAASML
jgi:hypothetical protein